MTKTILPREMPVFSGPVLDQPKAPAHIAICVPCVDKPHLEFMRCFAAMFYQNGVSKLPTAVVTSGGSIISKARNNCIAAVEEMESKQGIVFSHIFFQDSDMLFPDYILKALLAHDKDIVGCTYLRRTPPYDVHGRVLGDAPQEVHEGLIELLALPTGMMLIKRDIFRHLKRPFFRFPYREESAPGAGDAIEMGEDYAFCQMARDIGYRVWLDVTMTKLIGHVSERAIYVDQPVWAAAEALDKIDVGGQSVNK